MNKHAEPRGSLGHFGDDVNLHVGILHVRLDLLQDCWTDIVLECVNIKPGKMSKGICL